MALLGAVLLRASRSPSLRRTIVSTGATRRVVDRFVAGETLDDALRAVRRLVDTGIAVTLDHLGENVSTTADALATRDAYLRALDALASLGYGSRVEMSVKLSGFGQALPGGQELALTNVLPVAEAATALGTTITVDMEDSSTVESTLAVVAALRDRFPGTGAVLQAYLHRTPADLAALTGAGSRVRLVKGAYREPPTVALRAGADVDRAYASCLDVLMSHPGYPMIASHDPRLIARALDLAARCGRAPDSYEFQMLYGIRTDEQQRLADAGHQVRAYVPYGTDWYGYFMRRLAERPANVRFFLRALASRH